MHLALLAGSLLLSPVAGATTPPPVRAALAVGDCPAAIAALPSPDEDAERLALARCHAQLGALDAALAQLLAVRDPGLSAYAALVRGEALSEAGRFAEAAEALVPAQDLPGPAGRMARFLRGRALVEAGEHGTARDALNAALVGDLARAGTVPGPGEPDPGAIRWWLGQGAIRRGAPDKAVGVVGSVWARNPSSTWAGPAEAWLVAQGIDVVGLGDEAARALARERAETLDRQRRYADALALRDRLGVTLTPSQEARAAFRAKDYPRAVAAYARIASPTASERFDHALATSRTGDYAAAAELYGALLRAAPSSARADEASYKLGYLAYDSGELETALTRFGEHLARYPDSEHAVDTRWFSAWSLYKLGRLDQADAAFEDFGRRHGGSTLAANATYWQGRIRSDRGQDAEARSLWQAVLSRWPDSAAAFFASRRLGVRYERQDRAAPAAPAALASDPRFARGRALAEVGLGAWARAELSQVALPSDSAGREALADSLALAGDYVGARRVGRSDTADHPRPHPEVVGPIADAAGLHPLLPYAIMNAESALKPWVTSIAGARGLMQMMPALGETHHEARFGDRRPYDPDDLYLPGYNAALGTTELASLLARFEGAGVDPVLPLVIAGYNGGPDAVERWLSAYEQPPAGDRFAEDVGYTETRRYVRRVLGYLQQYRRIYGD